MADIQFSDCSGEILTALKLAQARALERIGLRAEANVIKLTPTDTGDLKESITHTVRGETVYIGTNMEYAVYVEFGTGIYASDGTGRKGWWVYVDGSKIKDKNKKPKTYTLAQAMAIKRWLTDPKSADGPKLPKDSVHITQGIKPRHMFKKGVEEQIDAFRKIVESELKG